MADTVSVKAVFDGLRRHVVHLTNESDGTGESAVIKVNLSELVSHGGAAAYSTVDQIEYDVQGFNYVVLEWDHPTNEKIAVLSGSGFINWREDGGKTDPQDSRDTGDIVLTTDGDIDGASYNITIWVRPKV